MILHPLGYPLDLEVTGAPAAHEIVKAARQSWGADQPRFHGRPLRMHVEVTRGGRPAGSRPKVSVRPGGFAIQWDCANRAEFASRLRTGYVRMSSVAAHRHLLETVVLSALDSVYFTPLHAACVARKGSAVLLCGDSGAGKSCLTYACARRGWTVIADDAVHLAPEDIVAGGSHIIRLREGARGLFPELDQAPARIAPNGKLAIETSGFATQRFGLPSQIVFLSRSFPSANPSRARLQDHPADAALAYFRKYLWHFDPGAHLKRITGFLKIGVRRLEYSDLREAVDVLESL